MADRLSLHPQSAATSGVSAHGIPPWEVRAVSRVPYLDRSPTPPRPKFEPPEHRTPRTLRSHSDLHTKSRPTTTNGGSTSSEYNHPDSQNARGVHWTKRRHTSAFPPQRALASYETPLDLPAGMENIRHRSIIAPTNSLPSPPDSPPSCNKSETSALQEVRLQALPGTMSSQASTAQDYASTRLPERHDRASTTRSQSEQRPISKRLTCAFRDIFKKDPVDESGFEHISDRHWAEES